MKLFGALVSPYVARAVLLARRKGLALAPPMPEVGRWWFACGADPVTGPFIREHSAAVDAFLKRLARK